MDHTDRTTTGSRTQTRAPLVRVLAATLLIALALAATGGAGPDGAEAAPKKHSRNIIKLDCAELNGTYYEYSDGSYGCLVNGLLTFCDSTGWCILVCFDGLGCECAGLGSGYDECVPSPHVKPNAPDDRRVVVETDTVGASAEDPPSDGPPVRSAAAGAGVVAVEAEPARTPVPEAAQE